MRATVPATHHDVIDATQPFPAPQPADRVATVPAPRHNTRRQRLAMILGSGLVFAFFSEFFFLNEGPTESVLALRHPGELLLFCLELGLWYSLFAAWFLVPVSMFGLRSVWGVFFAAALFGWAVEGVVIPYIYAGLPFSLLWPSMSWHVFVDVLLGWWLVRRLLHRNSYPWTVAIAVALGVAWGLWATWLGETEIGALSGGAFARVAFVTSTMWILGNIIIDRFGGGTFQPTHREMRALGAISFVLWALTSWAFTPFQFALPVLVWLVIRVLQRAPNEPGPNLIESFTGRIGWTHHLLMFLTPLVASATYRLWIALDVRIGAWIIAWPLLLAGLIMLVQGVRRLRPTNDQMATAI